MSSRQNIVVIGEWTQYINKIMGNQLTCDRGDINDITVQNMNLLNLGCFLEMNIQVFVGSVLESTTISDLLKNFTSDFFFCKYYKYYSN
jgi:hypothetical protein